MQWFEALLHLALALGVVRLLAGPGLGWLRYSYIAGTGLTVAAGSLLFESWRWQMLPAGVALAGLLACCLRRGDARLGWRVLGAIPLGLLILCSVVLTLAMPMVGPPAPRGPHGVGTFHFSITDAARIERYAPERRRELYVEVWYPADQKSLKDYPVSTLFQSLYEGAYNRTSFLFGYLKRVDTHSHVRAPVARDSGRFPVLLFNHALDFGFPAQNQRLMEHMASHGYVILSIAHPYQTPKVNLAEAGTVFRANHIPGDIVLPRAQLDERLIGSVFARTHDIRQVSRLKALLYPLAEQYLALDEKDRPAFLAGSVASAELQPFRTFVSAELLEDFILYDYVRDNSLTQYWVEDNRFILDSLPTLPEPIPGFTDVLDLEHVGVFGMSYGGSAAGEFCKIDRRCDAGANLDGTQLGAHWNQPVPVPFLMLYNDQHQGGNDFAYFPPTAGFWDYRVKGTGHTDFTDFACLWPILRWTGISGSIRGKRALEILDIVVLNFFDHYLKGAPIQGELHTNIPEIVARRSPVEERSGAGADQP